MGESPSERREKLAPEVEETFFCASGPGGQHRNRTETAVRLKHLPTGINVGVHTITVTATERRSQARNRDEAWKRLLEKLDAARRKPKKRIPTRPTRASRKKRVDEKKKRGQTKKSRRPPAED